MATEKPRPDAGETARREFALEMAVNFAPVGQSAWDTCNIANRFYHWVRTKENPRKLP